MSELPNWRGGVPFQPRLAEARRRLEAKFPSLAGVERLLPREALLARFSGYDVRASYGQLRPTLAAIERERQSKAGNIDRLGFALRLLQVLADTAEERWPHSGLAPALWADYEDAFHRMLDAISRGGSSAMHLETDVFAKYLAIALFRIAPLGGQLVDPGASLPRSLLWRATPSSLPGLIAAIVDSGGFTPFFEFHTHPHMRHLMTVTGWTYCFERLPLMFASFPRHRGVFGASWFFDPALARISPSLDFMREVSQGWGGRITRGGTAPGVAENAFAMSPERQAAAEAGRYRPMSFYMIAPRRAIMARARRSC